MARATGRSDDDAALMSTLITIWPLTTEHSRAARTKEPWYFRVMASLLPSGGGGGRISVEAP